MENILYKPTFLFDYDGTLCDTQHAIVTSMQALFQFHQHSIPNADELMDLVGSGNSIQETLLALAVNEKSITQWVNIYRNLYAQHEYLVRLFEGTHETLAYLHACKYRLILVSNTGRAAVDTSLKAFHLQGYFDLVIAEQNDFAKKPSALVLTERILPVFPDALGEQCVVVGDTAADLHFAKNIGANSCFAAYGFGNSLVCSAIGYTHHLEKLSDLITLYPSNSQN